MSADSLMPASAMQRTFALLIRRVVTESRPSSAQRAFRHWFSQQTRTLGRPVALTPATRSRIPKSASWPITLTAGLAVLTCNWPAASGNTTPSA
jgi:hypothetical protein